MQSLLAEALGTMMLVLLGDGVVANVLLERTKGQNAGWIVITTGWGVAVAIAIYAVGRISGGAPEPPLPSPPAAQGRLSPAQVPRDIAAQVICALPRGAPPGAPAPPPLEPNAA